MRPPLSRPLARLLVATVATTLAATLVATHGASASAGAPNPEPHPAAPIGGCAVTQGPTTTYSAASGVKLERRRTTLEERRVKRTPAGWRVRLRAEVAWRGTATVTATSTYASADCGVESRRVGATATQISTTTRTVGRAATARTKKAATRAARAKVRKVTRKQARPEVVALARDAAALKARLTFISELPTRDEHRPDGDVTVPVGRACPTRLATAATRQEREAAEAPGTVVPQFETPAAIWFCSYAPTGTGKQSGKLTRHQLLSGAEARTALAGIRSLGLPNPDPKDVACTADLGPTHVVSHVTSDGRVTSVVVQDFGCRDTGLTADLARTAAGTTTSRGVPSGTYHPSPTLRHLFATLSVRAAPASDR